MRISDVLRDKGEAVVTVAPGASVRELLGLLAEHNVGALVVSADGESIEGIVSERDVVRALVEAGDELFDAEVSSIMTSDVHSCTAEDDVPALMRLMTDERVRHVPVLADGRLSGIVSIGDVVKHHIGDLELQRDSLQAYISSGA